MIREHMGFEEALELAQQLGYAERDPAADVEGDDACRKICILASLAFGTHVYPRDVHTEGITHVTLGDVDVYKRQVLRSRIHSSGASGSGKLQQQ